MVVIKSGRDLLILGTLKSALSQEQIDQLADVLHADTSFGKLKITLIIIGWAWSKMRKALIFKASWDS